MNSYDALGYGTHVILDGFRADARQLADADSVRAALEAIRATVKGPGPSGPMVVRPAPDERGGISAVLLGSESHICVHTFGNMNKLCLDAFSTRGLPIEAITGAFVERFVVGRYECRVYGRGRRLPKSGEALERALDGDRQYARLRLRDLLGG